MNRLLSKAKKKIPSLHFDVIGVPNEFFGHTVDVAGLVVGSDIIRAAKGVQVKPKVCIPACMLRHGGDVFLDDLTLRQVSETISAPIIPLETDGSLFLEAILGTL